MINSSYQAKLQLFTLQLFYQAKRLYISRIKLSYKIYFFFFVIFVGNSGIMLKDLKYIVIYMDLYYAGQITYIHYRIISKHLIIVCGQWYYIKNCLQTCSWGVYQESFFVLHNSYRNAASIVNILPIALVELTIVQQAVLLLCFVVRRILSQTRLAYLYDLGQLIEQSA